MNAAREREAQQATLAYQTALARLGVGSTTEALRLWQHVPPTQKAATAAQWLNEAVAMVMSHRTQSVALARAYYRLARALLTGKTVADPARPEPEYVNLSDLRHQFSQLAGQGAQSPSAASGTPGSQTSGNASEQAAPPRENTLVDDDDRILVEEIERLKEQEAASLAAAEQEARVQLQTLGIANLEKQLAKIHDDQPAVQVDKQRQTAHASAGARQAATAARMAMNGARSTTWLHQEGDKLAIGWVRFSTTGTPCGWCAMLISRGAVYRSEKSAQFDYDDGDTYHDNCKCIAVPVFSREQYDTSPIFDLNRKYSALWPKVTRGLGGKDALAEWRRYIRKQQAGAAPVAA